MTTKGRMQKIVVGCRQSRWFNRVASRSNVGTLLATCVLIGLATTLLAPTSAFAESLTFNVRSFHKNQVDVAFYSQSRGVKWPSGGTGWIISDYEVHNYKLNCIRGEKICYGAWVRGSGAFYWGVGEGDKYSCPKCCYVCDGGSTPTINLNAK